MASAQSDGATDEVTALIARGDQFLTTGDIVSARLYYERAANTGSGHAALLMAETFDPAFLGRAGVRGVRGDADAAAAWYRRARDLGDRDAERRFEILDSK
jgi:TPR repeat protein